ncbi:MAG: DUF5398 family protein [Chlamydiota bacterium]
MFGLEEKEKKFEKFQFDLEVEMKENPARAQEILDLCEARIKKIKSILKTGAHPDSFDDLGVLIHGYKALMRVIKKIQKTEVTK